MTILESLIELGFEPVTEWVMKGPKIGPRSFDWKDHGGWLYTFVVDGKVKYSGLTDRVLRGRMSDYSHIKNRQLPPNCWLGGRSMSMDGNTATKPPSKKKSYDLEPNTGHRGIAFNHGRVAEASTLN